jgi:O-antigen/teichoic acid export membrane protein
MTVASPLVSQSSILAKTAKGTGWTMGWRMATRLLGLVNTLILVRLLTPADFGLVALGTTFANALDAFAMLGLEDALLREKAFSREAYDSGFTLAIIRAIAMGLVIGALAEPAGWFFHDDRLVWIIRTLAVATVIDGFRNVGVVEFRRTFQFDKEFMLWVVPRIVSIGLAIGCAFIFRSYWALMVGILTQRVLRVVFSYWMHPYRPRLSLSAWRRLTSYSVWNWAMSIVGQIRDQSASILIGRLLGPTQVGIFSVALEIATLPSTELIGPMGRAAFSGFNAARHAGLSTGEIYLRMIGVLGILAIPASLGLSLLADPLVKLAFGPSWSSAVPVMQVVGIACCLSLLSGTSDILFRVHGLMRLSFRLVSANALFRLVLLLAMIPWLGVIGAALAMAAATVLEVVLSVIFTVRHFGPPLQDLVDRLWRVVLASATMALALASTGLGWRVTQAVTKAALALELCAGVAGGVVVYAVTLLLLWFVAGRPAGAESDILTLLRRLRIRLPSLRRA